MKRQKALVITEDISRREFLNQQLEKLGYYPVWYPNIFAYRKAIELEEIKMVIADLSMPIEPKIDIIKRGAKKEPQPKLITIGKQDYLKSSKVLADYPMVLSIDNIQDFPEIVKK
jgi:DNA-binding NtrC family response regulator